MQSSNLAENVSSITGDRETRGASSRTQASLLIQDEGDRGQVLVELAPVVPQDLLAETLKAALTIRVSSLLPMFSPRLADLSVRTVAFDSISGCGDTGTENQICSLVSGLSLLPSKLHTWGTRFSTLAYTTYLGSIRSIRL